MRRTCLALFCFLCSPLLLSAGKTTFPGDHWETRTPGELNVDAAKLEKVAETLGGRGCVIKDGYVIHSWGDQAKRSDWLSSAKPVLSTLLFFALQEGLIESVDQPVSDFYSDLKGDDRRITFRHLGSMSSGFRRVEQPGKAWAYNDPAIQLYQLTLFDKVYKADPHQVAEAANRLGALGLEDGLKWRDGTRRLTASVRDFARIVWFWKNQGQWRDQQLLPAKYFADYMRPQTAKELPRTQKGGETEDYLGIGTYGGGSDHFTKFGAGIYGFNWWFNDTGLLHPKSRTWPDAPPETIMSIGFGGNCSAIFPAQNMILVCAKGDWGKLEAGQADSRMNQILATAASAVSEQKPSEDTTLPVSKWETLQLDFQGPQRAAADNAPNPFLDYKLQVTFTSPRGESYVVPGYFDGDGQGGQSGSVWRVKFSPDEVGAWSYQASFRQGPQVAIDLDPNAGEPTAFDGQRGSFTVEKISVAAPGFYRYGRLNYVGGHYLKFADGPYWIKGGTDSPEDFLAYDGFANTKRAKHSYKNHLRDWQAGDPDWNDGAGKRIIGALNYLASQEVNSLYLMPMNVGGDGDNVHPFYGNINLKGDPQNDNLHYDLEKLKQWGVVFDHAQRQGIFLHIVLNEAEKGNKRELDNAELGPERKLFYREMIARFGHLPALQWNLCEEYNLDFDFGPERIKAFAKYIVDTDPYDHPVTVHHSSRAKKVWKPFLGDPNFSATSFQENNDVGQIVEQWRTWSREAGRPLVIGMDEFFPDTSSAENSPRHRKEYLWPTYLSGGNIEFILKELLKTNDFRKYEPLWRDMAIARRFMEQELPFWEMEPQDQLLSGAANFKGEKSAVPGQVFAKKDHVYAVYLPVAEPGVKLDLQETGKTYQLRWFNPRTGAFAENETRVQGGKTINLGAPPNEAGEDWVVLLKSL